MSMRGEGKLCATSIFEIMSSAVTIIYVVYDKKTLNSLYTHDSRYTGRQRIITIRRRTVDDGLWLRVYDSRHAIRRRFARGEERAFQTKPE